MSTLRVRAIDECELEGKREMLGALAQGNEALANLSRLGGIPQQALGFGDGWAAAVDVDGTTLLVRGEPAGAGARWSIYAAPDAEGKLHAARKLSGLMAAQPR